MSRLLKLPSEISDEIFSRLPIRTIISCKCVCKKLLEQISSPTFVKHHLSRVPPGLILYADTAEVNDCRVFELEDDFMLQHHDLLFKQVMKFDLNIFARSPDSFMEMNCSVNGLVCLYDFDISDTVETIYVYNPITREYVSLPPITDPTYGETLKLGFGLCLPSGQYKVVRIMYGNTLHGVSVPYNDDYEIESIMIYTLGTHSWRSIQPNETNKYDYCSRSCYLKGNLHWLTKDAKGSQISCFDLESELFKAFPPPFPTCSWNSVMMILEDCLCICNYVLNVGFEIWVMEEYGVRQSWTKKSVIMSMCGDIDAVVFYALKVLDGDILMSKGRSPLFYHSCNNTGANPEVNLPGRDLKGWLTVLFYTPSFVSLRSIGSEGVNTF